MTPIVTILGPAKAGAFLMITAGALFALVNALVQYEAMSYGMAPSKIAFWQYLIALIFFLPWLASRLVTAFGTSRLGLHILRVGFSAAGVQVWVLGLAQVPIWQAIALVMLSPFFITVGAGMMLRESVTSQRWFAVIAGFFGGMIILAPWSETFTYHALLPVGAAVLWSFASLLTKHLTHTESPETLTVYLLLLLTPMNTAAAFNSGFALALGPSVLILLAAGVLTALAQYSLAKAYSIADAAYLQPFDHIKLPFNVLLGFLVFGFAPPGSMWMGSLLIVGASFYLLNEEARRTRPA